MNANMRKLASTILWVAVAAAGAFAYVTLAVRRGEHISSAYILLAALCSYAIGYRFYSKWIAARVVTLNDRRATPCEVHDDGKDFVRTNHWIVFVNGSVLTFDTSAKNCATNTIGSAGVAAESKRLGWAAEDPEASEERRRCQ